MQNLPMHNHDPGDLLAGGYPDSLSQIATDQVMADIANDFSFIKLSWKIQVPEKRDGYLTVFGELVK